MASGALRSTALAIALLGGIAACGTSSGGSSSGAGDDAGGGAEAGSSGSGDDAGWPPVGDDIGDGGGHPQPVDGGYPVGDASIPATRFVTRVVSFTPTDCAGFGAAQMPDIVEGPPVGGGTGRGSTDVVSLGSGGSIVLAFDPDAIVDGPGPDFIVFENPFWIGGNATDVYAEPGQVSVSDDGVAWHPFPCAPASDPGASDGTGVAPPYGSCAGWHAVYAAPGSGISPLDPMAAGGDAFDLADIGVTHARYVRIDDRTSESCPEAGAQKPTTNGFDLDAVAIVNAAMP